MKILMTLSVLFITSFSCYIIPQNNKQSSSYIYELTEDIKCNDIEKYLNAKEYIEHDSLFNKKCLYFSPYLIDLDFFYFNTEIENDTTINGKLPIKNRWFKDFYSLTLKDILKNECKEIDYIVFFSLIENDMLRVDVLPNRKGVATFRFDDVSLFCGEELQAYLFSFKKKSNNLRKVYRLKIKYD